jgi:hypothetical protein
MTLKVLTMTTLSTGLIALIIEFVIRAQVNRHPSPDERVGIHELQSPAVWLGRNGLLARHKRFYPQSRLSSIFRVLWVLFFATFGALIICVKVTGSH